jgi:hypothetical protein
MNIKGTMKEAWVVNRMHKTESWCTGCKNVFVFVCISANPFKQTRNYA